MEAPDLALGGAGAGGDAGVLALRVDADHRAVDGQQIGNDGAYALAAARRGHGQEMGGAVIAQQLAGSEGSTNQEIALVARKGAHVIDSTEGGRAEQRVAATLETIFPDRSEEHTSELQSLMRNSSAVFCLKK